MDFIWDNLFFIALCSTLLIIMTVGYIRTIRSGKKRSVHKYRNIGKWEVLLSIVAISCLGYFELQIVNVPLRATYFFAIYILILFIMNSHPIITTDKGFYYRGQFMKWSNITKLSVNEANVLEMTVLTMIYTNVKIKKMSDLETFIRMADQKGISRYEE